MLLVLFLLSSLTARWSTHSTVFSRRFACRRSRWMTRRCSVSMTPRVASKCESFKPSQKCLCVFLLMTSEWCKRSSNWRDNCGKRKKSPNSQFTQSIEPEEGSHAPSKGVGLPKAESDRAREASQRGTHESERGDQQIQHSICVSCHSPVTSRSR